MLPHVLPGEVCLCLFMGFEATPLAYTPVTVFSLRVLVPLTWSVLHSCVVSNASLFSPADAVLLSSTMVKFPCGRTCPRSNSWKSWLSAFRCPQCNPRLATKIVIASLRNESVSRCLVDVNLGAALQQPNQECDASCNAAHRCVAMAFPCRQDIRVGLEKSWIWQSLFLFSVRCCLKI